MSEHARATDPWTSHDAVRKHTETRQVDKIFAAAQVLYEFTDGELTDYLEQVHGTRFQRNVVARQRTTLVKRGRVESTGRFRNNQTIWRVV